MKEAGQNSAEITARGAAKGTQEVAGRIVLLSRLGWKKATVTSAIATDGTSRSSSAVRAATYPVGVCRIGSTATKRISNAHCASALV